MPLDRPVRSHPLRLLTQDGDVIVGRVDVDSCSVFLPDGAALVQRLADRATPRDAAEW